jgi:hypothetical protein
MHISAHVVFQTPLTLDQVGELVADRLLGGIRFVGREEHLRDEVPSIRSESDVLGLRVLIQGHGGEAGYTLEIYPRLPSVPIFAVTRPEDEADLTAHVADLLRTLPGISIQQVS